MVKYSNAKRYRIIGNWKMHKTSVEAIGFIQGLLAFIEKKNLFVGLAVPFTCIHAAAEITRHTRILIGAQNMHDASEGAFTGETSAAMLKEAGAQFVILGHSERRHLFHETDAWINRKIRRALAERLQPVLCVGETLEERENGHFYEVINRQLSDSLKSLEPEQVAQMVVAYEPVWAIGTGKVATPEIAQEMHQYCREVLTQHWGNDAAEQVSILYGGSVKSDNVKNLLMQKEIDGVLVGGASLFLESFVKIVDDVERHFVKVDKI